MQSLLNRSLSIERKPRINLSRHLSRHNLQDLLSKLDQKTVEGGIDLVIDVLAVFFAVGDGSVDEFGVFGFLGGGEDEGWVGGCVLWFVCGDCWGGC